MKIVVTGSESFIGRELRRHCRARQMTCVGIDTAPSEGADHATLDIRSLEIAKGIPEKADALVHLAAISRTQDCLRNPPGAFDVNVGGTLNLVRAAKERGVKQFIFASSEWVYGEASNGHPQREDSVIDAERIPSEYALTKFLGERALFLAYQGGLCPVTVLRFGIVYGPRPNNWSAVESLFHAVGTQDVVEVKGSLATARRFIHVSDVAEGLLAALGRGGFEVFNLSGDSLVTLRGIIEASKELLGRSPEVVERDPSAVSIHNADNQKARILLGWKPAVDLKTGLLSLESACSKS